MYPSPSDTPTFEMEEAALAAADMLVQIWAALSQDTDEEGWERF